MATEILATVAIITKAVVIPGVLLFIFFMLMVIGIIPGERICKFLREHKRVQMALGIVVAISLLGAIIASALTQIVAAIM